MSRLTLLILPVALAVLGAGCGSSSHAATPAAAASAVPSVANAGDLHAKPQIGAGSPPKPTKLASKDLVVGTGQVATASATVSVQYIGVNYDDGKEFDSSWAAGGTPVDFPLSGVIPGFAQGIVGMKVGGRRELVIPPDLGYGAGGNGPVGPNETLVFVIDLVAVK